MSTAKFEIRDNDCTGTKLGTIEISKSDLRCCVEAAAARAIQDGKISRRFRTAGWKSYGVHRQTGAVGLSGIFSVYVHSANGQSRVGNFWIGQVL
jgi:hypothetical protein